MTVKWVEADSPYGAYIEGYGYDAYGNQSKSLLIGNPFQYCGEYYDEETGMTYLRARYYDPSIGRFISEDPVKDGLNWYIYCANNPVNNVDSWGLDVWYLNKPDTNSPSEVDVSLLEKKFYEPVYLVNVTTFEEFVDAWVFAKKQDYEISKFIVEQQSGLAACSKTLNELLYNQSVRNILTPNISGLSREISVLQDILRTAKKNNKNIISTDGSCEAYPLY